MHTELRSVLLIAIAALLAACGPATPFDIAMQSYPSNITIGGDNRAVKPAVPAPTGQVAVSLPKAPGNPAATLRPYGPGIFPPPTSIFQRPLSPAPPSCNSSLLTPTDNVATTDSQYSPAPSVYAYRLMGSYFDSADGTTSTYPAGATRTISNVVPPSAAAGTNFTFDVTQVRPGPLGGDFTTTISYHVVPVTPANAVAGPIGDPTGILGPPVGNANDPGGVYLTKVVSDDPGSFLGVGTFQPAGTPAAVTTDFTGPTPTGLKIINYYAGGPYSSTWHTEADDPAGTTLSLDGTFTTPPRTQVDACVANLQVWAVHLTGTVSGSRNGYVDLTWGIGTTYGGFLLSEANCVSASAPPKGKTACDVANVVSQFAAISQRPDCPPGAPATYRRDSCGLKS